MYASSSRKRIQTGGTKPSFGASPQGGSRGPRVAKVRPKSTLDPRQLIKRATSTEVINYVSERSFAQMPLQAGLKANILHKGYNKPTQIQDETLEALLAGRNLIGVASTGTGKTGSFLIPIIDQLLQGRAISTLVVVPTRELALQVETEFKSLAHGLKLSSASFIGGTSLGKDLSQLQRKQDVIIGTPGRLMDLAQRRALDFGQITTLVLDEFDRMLDMGFVNDIKRMVAAMKNRQQTMLFSATIDRSQEQLIGQLVQNAMEVKVTNGSTSSDQVDQDIIRVPAGADKFDLLLGLFQDQSFEKVILFTETKRLADKVSKRLNEAGVKSDQIHGNKSQNYRNNALDKFKRGGIKVLVATDVAARGIDVSDVSHVINYELPMTYDSYVHRIGRTGRAGKSGKAFTFVD